MAEPPSKPPSPPPAASGFGDKDENIIERRSLRDYYIILRERVWIALPLALLVSIGLGYYQSRETPMYQATATMQFEKPERVVTTTGVTDTSITSEVDLNTRIQVLQSTTLRAKVAASFTPEELRILQRAALKKLPPGTAPPAPDLGSVNISAVRNSYLINITVQHQDPEAAALVANRYVDQFMRRLREEVSGVNEDAVKQLNEAADRLRQEAASKEQALQRYMVAHNLISLDASTNTITKHLMTVDSARTDAHIQVTQLQNQLNQVQDYQRQGRDLFEIGAIANYGNIPTLRSSLASLESNQLVLADRYLERHPKMIEIANQISNVKDQLDRATSLAIAELKASLEKARDNEQSLVKEMEKTQQDNLHLKDMAVEFSNLQQESDSAKRNYMDVLDRLNQTTTLKNIENEKIPLHPLDSAYPPGLPFKPNLNNIIKTCSGVGVLVFIGVAVGLSFVDDRIKSAWDVEHFIGLNLLGIIPDLSALKDEDKYTLVLNNNQSPGVESFLSVYSAVKIHSKLDFPKSILVTSTIPGEGKTLISCNLAGSFARHGKKTLLIDCDLRRPMLHRHFKQQNNAGVIQWYENGANLDGDITGDPTLGIIKVGENLSLLCSGGRSKGPTEILESQAFSQLIQRLKRQYDLVVVDSPPLGAVTDSLLIAERTDEVIYVCRFNRAYRKHIRMYVKALRNGRNEVLGIVLNGLSPRRIEYYSNYRYYRSYKKYYGAQT